MSAWEKSYFYGPMKSIVTSFCKGLSEELDNSNLSESASSCRRCSSVERSPACPPGPRSGAAAAATTSAGRGTTESGPDERGSARAPSPASASARWGCRAAGWRTRAAR